MMGPAEPPEDDLETLSHSTQAHSADAVAAETRRDSPTIAEARQVRIISRLLDVRSPYADAPTCALLGPHGHRGGGWLAGSLAERHEPQQRGSRARQAPRPIPRATSAMSDSR